MFEVIAQLITAEKLKSEFPVPADVADARIRALRQIRAILSGEDRRKLVLVGPCSADDPNAALEYADRLSRVSRELSDRLYFVMRAYTAKPRTRGEGYMGLLHTPIFGGEIDIGTGLYAMRKLHIAIPENFGLFTADEMFYPEATEYVDDILSYVTVGARSCGDGAHRFAASGSDIPVGVKNPTGGSIAELLGSIHAISKSNEFMYKGCQVRTSGNAYAHAVLRGGTDANGNGFSNFDEKSVLPFVAEAEAQGLCPSVIIDLGHANSGKDPARVPVIAKSVLASIKSDPSYRAAVKGFMIESYLFEGSSPIVRRYGTSVTDPCLGWDGTRMLLYEIADGICP